MSAEPLHVRLETQIGEFQLSVDETFAASGVTAVFGPSGAGKSTLLRCIAGLERPLSGRIAQGDVIWFDSAARVDMSAHRRGVGYLFQDGRLFHHLTVAGNMRFAQRRAPRDGPKLEDVADALGLDALMERRVQTLSGGERQRAALGRTLMANPEILLLDEPLAALDDARKHAILPYLETVQRRFGRPTLYVTHSLDECARLAASMLVLSDGQVLAHGPVKSVFEALDLAPEAGRFDSSAVIDGRVLDGDETDELVRLDIGGGQTLSAPNTNLRGPGDRVRIRVRARDVAVALERPQRISIQNCLKGIVVDVREADAPAHADILIDLGDQKLRARITQTARRDLALEPGLTVFALVKTVSFETPL